MTPKTRLPLVPLASLRRLACATALLAALLPAGFAHSYDPDTRDRLVDLTNRSWRFSIGDDARWADPAFDDHGWSRIEVPDAWEEDGYDGYNGYAWYRYTFKFSGRADQATNLLLGRIDDADEVYVNGTRIGATGRFPPNYATAWDRDRVYPLPAGTLNADQENVIAVRVYDAGGDGGIRDGAIGLYTSNLPLPAVDLTGEWQFHAGDNPAWKDPVADTTGFTPIRVPGTWESAGFEDLDGFAWYRKSFSFTRRSDDATMVLMLGKIDDTDEVYLNGTKIGGTGNLRDSDRHGGVGYYAETRGYYFPASLLKETNLLAVRVHDHGGQGGIYEGPVGLISQRDYIEYWETVRHDRPHHRTARAFFRWLAGD